MKNLEMWTRQDDIDTGYTAEEVDMLFGIKGYEFRLQYGTDWSLVVDRQARVFLVWTGMPGSARPVEYKSLQDALWDLLIRKD